MEDDTTVTAPYIFRGIEYIVTMNVKDGNTLCVEVEDKLTADQWRAEFDSAYTKLPTMFVCWECEKPCTSKDALKVHVATHGFTRVFCPWCFDQKRNYRRMVDLKTHLKSAHPEILSMEKEIPFLKEKAGFFLAENPAEYRRAIGTVPAEDAPASVFLQEAVRDWCESFRGKVDRPLTQWKQLWLQCGGLFTPERQPALDYCYSPSRPDLDVLYSLEILASGAVAVVYGSTGDGVTAFRRLTLSRSTVSTEKKRERLTRRRNCLSSKPRGPPAPVLWEEELGSTNRYLARMAEFLGMEVADVTKVEKRRLAGKRATPSTTMPPPPTPAKKHTPSKENTKETPTHSDTNNDHPAPETDHDFSIPEADDDYSLLETDDHPLLGTDSDIPTNQEPDQAPQSKSPEHSEPIDNTGDHAISMPESNDTFDDTENHIREDQPSQEPSLDEDLSEATPNATSADTREQPTIQSSATDLVATICPAISRVSTTIQERAKQILAAGCMPLCPPARREWKCGAQIQIPIPGPLSVWPPKDWQLMTPDTKLLTFETVATLLHTCIYDKTPEDRNTVIDTFNFLALPGMKERKLVAPSELMRFYNYTTIRKISVGEYRLTDGEIIVKQFEAAASVMTPPKLYTILLEAIKDIPLRI